MDFIRANGDFYSGAAHKVQKKTHGFFWEGSSYLAPVCVQTGEVLLDHLQPLLFWHLQPQVTMEALKFVVVLLVVVFMQVFGALGTPLSSGDQDGEIWTVENWQVKHPQKQSQIYVFSCFLSSVENKQIIIFGKGSFGKAELSVRNSNVSWLTL